MILISVPLLSRSRGRAQGGIQKLAQGTMGGVHLMGLGRGVGRLPRKKRMSFSLEIVFW